MAFSFGFLYECGLVFRQDFGEELIHADLLCDGSGGALAVAGHHNGVGDAQLPQFVQHAGSFRTQGVSDAEHAGQPARSGQIEVRVFWLKGVELLLLVGRDGAVLILEDEVMAADDDPFAAHPACDAVSHDIFHLGVHLFVGDAAALGLTHHGVCHGVGEVLLEAGSQLQHLALGAAGEGHDLDHLGSGVGESAGLVEHDGVSLGQSFQILAALDGDMACAAFPHGREDGQRHGELEGTGEIHHQAGDGTGSVAGQNVGDDRSAQAPGHQTVGQGQCTVLSVGLELFGLLNHGNNLIIAVGAAHSFGSQDALTLFHHSSGIDGGTDGLPHRHGFAGESGLIHHGLAFQHGAIQRDHIAGADDDLIAGTDFGQGNQNLGILRTHPDLIDIQGHAAGQVVQTLLAGPLFQQGADIKQEHD